MGSMMAGNNCFSCEGAKQCWLSRAGLDSSKGLGI